MTISGFTLQTDKMLFVVEDGIGWLTFNQPEKRNAINLAMADSLGDILEYCQENDDKNFYLYDGHSASIDNINASDIMVDRDYTISGFSVDYTITYLKTVN